MTRPFALIAVLAMGLALIPMRPGAGELGPAEIGALARQALSQDASVQQAALDRLVARGELDIVPSLVLALRIGGEHVRVGAALTALTGTPIRTWREAMLWQEAHPEIAPHSSYADLKLWWWRGIDRRFLSFFPEPAAPEEMRIRFEEITWGGVRVDGIPALDHPSMVRAEEAGYLVDSDLVFGVEINGDARAYPLRIMGWHEMVNDVVGGVPVALAYCTLCGAGILFETAVEERQAPFVFGSSGLLYRSNKLMFDRATLSLWNQFTGEPVTGPLARSGLQLAIRPMTITAWSEWKARHPDTQVLSLETGFFRDYDPGVAYRDYFASPELMFPTRTDQTRLRQKDYVYGIRVAGGAKAWPLEAFAGTPVIQDRVGFTNVVLIGDAATRTVRAYDRGAVDFTSFENGTLAGPGGVWRIGEDALSGPDGQRLPRVPGHIAYWFAWDGYLGVESELYSAR